MDQPNQPQPQPQPQTAAPAKKKRSTAFKVAVGCGAFAVVGLFVITVAVVAGVSFLGDKARAWTAAFEDQAALTTEMRALEETHAFRPSADGEVSDDRQAVFLEVTRDAWDSVREETSLLERLAERAERSGEIRQMGIGLEGIGGLARARASMAAALSDHDMPPSEFIWIASQLRQSDDESVAALGALPGDDENATTILGVLATTLTGTTAWMEDSALEP